MSSSLRRHKIVIDDKIPFIRGEAERLGDCIYAPGAAFTRELVQDADMLIIRTRTHCNATLLEGTSVKHIVTATIGFDHIDTAYLAQRGIAWRNCPGCNAGGVAQYVHTVLLKAAECGFLPESAPVIGIVGVGNVGKKVAAWLTQKGYRVLLNDPPREAKGDKGFVPLSVLAEQCEVITFHTPLITTGQWPTLHLADTNFFAQCQRHPLIINTARGGVVDESAWLDALTDGRVRAAVVDTWEQEPHINAQLLRKAWIATPHIAGYSADGKANATRMALEAAAEFLGANMSFHITPPFFPNDAAYHPYTLPTCEALRRYDPTADSTALKCFPALFEQLRGNYPLRREEDR